MSKTHSRTDAVNSMSKVGKLEQYIPFLLQVWQQNGLNSCMYIVLFNVYSYK